MITTRRGFLGGLIAMPFLARLWPSAPASTPGRVLVDMKDEIFLFQPTPVFFSQIMRTPFGFTGHHQKADLYCGAGRLDVKHLADLDAKEVKFNPQPLTIENANLLSPICNPRDDHHRYDVEKQVWQVTGYVLGEPRHEADGDIHVVLTSSDHRHTMIVEAPSIGCVKNLANSGSMIEARQRLARAHHGDKITVVGPAFYDRAHGQSGMARSCIEVHPVLWVR